MTLLSPTGKISIVAVPQAAEMQIPNCINNTGSIIPQGSACQINSGTDGFGNANASIVLTTTRIDGYALTAIHPNDYGALGCPGIPLGGFGANAVPGTPYYLDPAGSGKLSTVLPSAEASAIADPTAPVVVSATAGGSIPNGVYAVYYQNKNANGHTKLTTTNAPYTSASTNQTLHVGALAFPTGVTSRDIFMETTPGSGILKFVKNDATAGAFDITAVPTDIAVEPTDTNTTSVGAGADQRIQAIGMLNGLIKTR